MLKFALGLTSGVIIGITGTFIGQLLLIVALEDSPELLDTLRKNSPSE